MIPFILDHPVFTTEQNKIMSTSNLSLFSTNRNKAIIVYHDEVFLPIIGTDYAISNFGTLYNLKLKNQLTGTIDNRGYLRYTMHGKQREAHRLIMEVFNPIDNMQNLQVNHIDGNKLNNYYNPNDPLNNLEWCTLQENIYHAWKIGLCKNSRQLGEKHGMALRSNKEIHKICQLLEKGYSSSEIANILGIEYNPLFSSFLSKIRRKKIWRCISDQYHIQ